jgi:zinc-ribbon family
MIIYGSKAVHLKSVQPSTVVCPSCGQTGTTVLSTYSKHSHIFWIPIFPFGRMGVSQCQHCKHAIADSKLPHELKREYNNLKAETKVPIWQFSGLGVIAIMAIFISYSSGESKKKEQEYVANPVVGDIYKYKTEKAHYSTLKVISVSADSVFVSPNEYETDKMSGVYKIDKEENYADFSYGISKGDLKQMHTDADIYEIDRN